MLDYRILYFLIICLGTKIKIGNHILYICFYVWQCYSNLAFKNIRVSLYFSDYLDWTIFINNERRSDPRVTETGIMRNQPWVSDDAHRIKQAVIVNRYEDCGMKMVNLMSSYNLLEIILDMIRHVYR